MIAIAELKILSFLASLFPSSSLCCCKVASIPPCFDCSLPSPPELLPLTIGETDGGMDEFAENEGEIEPCDITGISPETMIMTIGDSSGCSCVTSEPGPSTVGEALASLHPVESAIVGRRGQLQVGQGLDSRANV
jgi:hypothetical protein